MATSSGSISTTAGPIDVADIVNKLMTIEYKSKAAPLDKKAGSINAAISAYGSLKAALSTYQSALKGLNPASFNALKASVVNAGTGAGAGAGASPTTDALSAEVNQDELTKKLAQKLQSGGFPSNHVFNRGDVMAVKVGNNPPTFITLKADATLAGLRDTINASRAGVSASIVNDSAGERLVLESHTAGAPGTIRITAAGTLSGLAYGQSQGNGSGMTQIQAPRDDTKAAAGSYAVEVLQLAQTHKLNSIGIAPGTTFSNGILAIKSGSGSTVLIQSSNNSLAGLRDAINASDAGVNASIINDGAQDRLIISAKKSGAANAITITGTGDYSLFSFKPGGTAGAASASSMGQAVEAQDARVTIDGVPVTSDSNSIKNVLSGVQLNLSKTTGPGDKLTLNIANDASGMTTAANTFVSAYNTLAKTMADLTRFTPSTKRGERGESMPLSNESAVRSIIAQLRGTVTGSADGYAGLTHLASIGITFQKDGTLALDSTKFADVTNKNSDAVSHLLGSKHGIVAKLGRIMEQQLGNDGLLERKTQSLQASLKATEQRQQEVGRRLADMRDQIANKYNRLNKTMAAAESRGRYLTAQLESLSKGR